MIVFNIMFYLPRSSNDNFVVQGFLFSPRNLYFWFGFDFRNKNNIDVDNNFTQDSTLGFQLLDLKFKKMVVKKDDPKSQRWYSISKQDSKGVLTSGSKMVHIRSSTYPIKTLKMSLDLRLIQKCSRYIIQGIHLNYYPKYLFFIFHVHTSLKLQDRVLKQKVF